MGDGNKASALFLLVLAGSLGLGGATLNSLTTLEPIPTQDLTRHTNQATETFIPPSNLNGDLPVTFTVKAVHVNLCNIMYNFGTPAYTPSYISNWRNILTTLGVNTLRIEDGGEARYGYRVNIDANWADNLMYILDTINPDRTGATGFKVYWQYLGDPWDLEFGINDAYRVPGDVVSDGTGTGGTGLLAIATVQDMIDRLANDVANSQNWNFITDPRIIGWAVGNECKVGTSSGGVVTTNAVYTWLTAIQDYIQGKGGVVIANAPYVDDWDMSFAKTAPLFVAHTDYIETHEYRVLELASTYCYSKPALSFNWAGWQTFLEGILNGQMSDAVAAGYAADKVILGEFGIFPAFNTDWNTGVYWTEQTQHDYYTYYFQALAAVNAVKWVSPFCAFKSGAYNYWFIDAPSGAVSSAYEVIRDAYIDIGPIAPMVAAPTLSVSSVVEGNPVSASTLVTGLIGTPTGYASFWVSTDNAATWTQVGGQAFLYSGAATTTANYVPSAAGTVLWKAIYYGNASYTAKTSTYTSLTVTESDDPKPIFYYYVVVMNSSGGVTVPNSKITSYQYIVGQTASFTAYPNPNYHLERWLKNGVDSGSASTINVVGVANAQYTLQAEFSANVVPPSTWTLIISSSGGSGTVYPDVGAHTITTLSQTVTATSPSGTEFVNWLYDGTTTYTSASITLTAAYGETHTLKANFRYTTVVNPQDNSLMFDTLIAKAEKVNIPSFDELTGKIEKRNI